jgi:hypothetical protein
VLISLEVGFNLTICIALVLYGCALAVFRKMRNTVSRQAVVEPKDSNVTTPQYEAPWQPGPAARSSRS